VVGGLIGAGAGGVGWRGGVNLRKDYEKMGGRENESSEIFGEGWGRGPKG